MPDFTGTTAYPGALDTFDTTKDNADPIGQDVTDVRKAVVAIETELGTDPAGAEATVKDRIAAIEGLSSIVNAAEIDYFSFLTPGGSSVQNTTGFDIFLTVNAGVVSDPGENGHIYFQISEDNSTWFYGPYKALRNNQATGTGGTAPIGGGTGHIGDGNGIGTFVPDGWYVRLTTATAAGGYAAPSYVVDATAPLYIPFNTLGSGGGGGDVAAHIADTTDAHDATAISYAGNTALSSTNVEAALDELDNEKQPLDSDLTAIAALSPSNDDVVQRKSGAWTNRTMAQLKTDLALAKGDVGLGNVTNDAQVTKGLLDAKGDLIVASANDTPARLAVGTNGHVLTADSAEATGVKWAAASGGGGGSVATDTIYDAKGDIPVGTGSDASDNLGVGANGTVLTADSAEATGVKWATPDVTQTELDALKSLVGGVYREVLFETGNLGGNTASGTYFFAPIIGTFALALAATTGSTQSMFYLDPADYAMSGLTTKFRVVANIQTNATAPGITYTCGLYPISATGGATANLTMTAGTVVSGSTVAFASPGASNGGAGANSGDFTAPSSGSYAFGVALSGTSAANATVTIKVRLQVRNT